MSPLPRIFVTGLGPIPPEAGDRLHAPGLRAWGIVRELALAGHPVRLATLQFADPSAAEARTYDLHAQDRRVAPKSVLKSEMGEDALPAWLLDQARAFGAEGCIGTTELANRQLGLMDSELPLWLDFFGDPMAERQMLAKLHEDDGLTAIQWSRLTISLRRGDRFSGCSRYQAGAIYGELGSVGRLNRHTAGEALVHCLAPWIEPIEPSGEPGPFLRGTLARADAQIAVQTGGFNTWLDVETLFAALERAMEREPRLHFAATGGAIPGHNEISFGRFESLVAGSRFRDRFHLLGWLPLGRIPRVIAECDLGLNVDLPCPEGWLGTRNRLMDWTLAGLPVVSTLGTELAESLAAENLIVGAPQGNAEAIASAILRVLAEGPAARERAAAAKRYLEEHHSPARCLGPLLEWAKSPKPAPDLQSWRMGSSRPPELWSRARQEAQGAEDTEELRRQGAALERKLETLQGSRLVKAALWLRERFGGG